MIFVENTDTIKWTFDIVGIGVEEIAATVISVYPNPSTGIVKVSLDEAAVISVVNELGQVIIEIKAEEGITEIDLPKGTFIIKVGDATETVIVK